MTEPNPTPDAERQQRAEQIAADIIEAEGMPRGLYPDTLAMVTRAVVAGMEAQR